MELPVNTFKQRLKNEQLIGMWVGLANATGAEIAATAGFDWLLIDGEHAPNDIPLLLEQLRAVAPYASHPVVRPSTGDAVQIKQLLDIGAQTLLVPMVETAEQAAHLVRAMHYPPHGIRGVGAALARASRWNSVKDYIQNADAQMCLLVQVETASALANIEAIAAVEGVDGVFIGPADLSASMGHPGNPGHPDVQAAIEAAIASIRQAGKAAGILSANESLARHYLALGCAFVAVGVDTSLLATAQAQLAARFRGAAPAAAAPAQPAGPGY